ncbi:Non-catalytic module family DOC2, partial [Piromyces sp. E2]
TRCSFEVLGYHCCSSVNPKVVKEDSYGKWGEEDGELCGIGDNEKFFNWDHNPTPITVCFSEAFGYPCCSDPNTSVVTTDEYGQWGIENNIWCGI